MHAPRTRYHPLAIILHWVMACAFFLMLASGLAMENLELERSFKFRLYQWHKSLGVLLLLAAGLRLLLRLMVNPPAWPARMSARQKKAASLGHWGLYAWMVALPASGWVMVSASAYGLPTLVFGWFEWPHIPAVAGNAQIESSANNAHRLLAYSFMALIAGHIAAVIRHALMDKEKLLPRMGIGNAKGENAA